MKRQLVLIIILFASCSNFEKSERERVRRQSAKVDTIKRLSSEESFIIPELQAKDKEVYPWQKKSKR